MIGSAVSKGDLENRELNKTEDFLSGKSCPSLGRPELVFWLHTAIKDPVSKLPALFGWFLYLLHPGLSSSQEAEKKRAKIKRTSSLFYSVFLENSPTTFT